METIIACVESSFPNWGVWFLSEADSVASSSFEILQSRYKVFRHWPGPGSRSMCFVVRSPLSSLSFAVQSRNRVLSLEMWCQGTREPSSICFVGLQGPHEDVIAWQDFCSDFMELVGSRRFKGPLVAGGDWNCDFGPTF